MKNGIIVSGNGTKVYYKDDMVHNEGGPAVIYANGAGVEYWIDGKPHKEDGPAFVYSDGRLAYWIEGKFIDAYYPNSICFTSKSRKEALRRLDSKERPYCRKMYLAEINAKWPIEEIMK